MSSGLGAAARSRHRKETLKTRSCSQQSPRFGPKELPATQHPPRAPGPGSRAPEKPPQGGSRGRLPAERLADGVGPPACHLMAPTGTEGTEGTVDRGSRAAGFGKLNDHGHEVNGWKAAPRGALRAVRGARAGEHKAGGRQRPAHRGGAVGQTAGEAGSRPGSSDPWVCSTGTLRGDRHTLTGTPSGEPKLTGALHAAALGGRGAAACGRAPSRTTRARDGGPFRPPCAHLPHWPAPPRAERGGGRHGPASASAALCHRVTTCSTDLLGVLFPEVSDIHVVLVHWRQVQEREREGKVQVDEPKQLGAAHPSKQSGHKTRSGRLRRREERRRVCGPSGSDGAGGPGPRGWRPLRYPGVSGGPATRECHGPRSPCSHAALPDNAR